MLKSDANQYQYLFLGGILGEILELPFIGNYLKVNKEILENEGISDIDYRTLSSLRSAHKNAIELNKIIESKFIRKKRSSLSFVTQKHASRYCLVLKEMFFFLRNLYIKLSVFSHLLWDQGCWQNCLSNR